MVEALDMAESSNAPLAEPAPGNCAIWRSTLSPTGGSGRRDVGPFVQ
jgi:hypothetical protein